MNFELESVTDDNPLAQLYTRTPKLLSRDWYNNTIATPIEYWLGRNSRALLFAARYHGNSELFSGLQANQFYEGLWERDVFEVFLRDPVTGAYQEWNLSPQGAWWSAAFSNYRSRDVNYKPDLSRVEAFGDVTANGWTAALIFPLENLYPGLQAELLEISVCGILGSSPRHYLCLKSDPNSQPDFHHANGFQALSSRVKSSSRG